ncbi:MAG TPA: transcription antitermination factor NusB [Desulfobacteraceae bacterium]|nr:transcription antitermination factor NusB [Desulfobacteraceae bacterium]HPJ68913.1 transcription antitermination factor NusB [Desulfobacteraceae bacterium]HPQ29241.1 transcription antitermination factor NusB [Desulfobacteraceae bacterium]
MGKRRRARELALQVLFSLEFIHDDPNDAFELICGNFNFPKSIRSFSKKLVLDVYQQKGELDRLIGKASENWRVERMARLDRCILRLAALEIIFLEDIPPRVSIDEAVELGKKFGSENSSRFINGLLDSILNSLDKKEQ